jgi:hypothetical protein
MLCAGEALITQVLYLQLEDWAARDYRSWCTMYLTAAQLCLDAN